MFGVLTYKTPLVFPIIGSIGNEGGTEIGEGIGNLTLLTYLAFSIYLNEVEDEGA